MSCDIIIPVWNMKHCTESCVESIIKNTVYPYRLVVIDNGSSAETSQYLNNLKYNRRIFDYMLIRNEKNQGYIIAANQGIKATDSDYVCIANNDIVVYRGWLTQMVRIAESNDDIGIVNPNSNSFGLKKKPEDTFEDFAASLLKENSGKHIEIGAAVGFCYLVKRKVINDTGYWDERFSPGYFEDTEYSMRAKKHGYKSAIALGAYVYHDEHSSFKSKEKRKNFEKLFAQSREKFYALYGKPKRILFVLDTKPEDMKVFNIQLYQYADKGNFVDVMIKKSLKGLEILSHGNVKKIISGDMFFKLKVLLKVFAKKKKYDAVFIYGNE